MLRAFAPLQAGGEYLAVSPNAAMLSLGWERLLDIVLHAAVIRCAERIGAGRIDMVNGSRIHFMCSDNLISGGRGFILDGIWLDEPQKMGHGLWTAVRSLCRPKTWVSMTGDSVMEEWRLGTMEEFLVVKARTENNTYLTQEQRQRIKVLKAV